METIKDIAKACGVGVSTVSRAINNHPDINSETKEMIMKVIKEHNYIPNNSARNLKRSKGKAIAVLIKGISNPFFSSMISIMEKEAQKKKYSFILQRVEERENELDVALELVKEKRLNGLVFLGGYISHSQEKLEQLEVPYVLSTMGVIGMEELPKGKWTSVSVDDYKESFKMTDYLCQLGHKEIAIITAGELDESIGKLRLEGYLAALKKNHITPKKELIRHMSGERDQYNMETGYRMMKVLLQEKRNFTAVYAIADSLAIGACRAIREAGFEIPEDYSVAGFDGIDMGEYYVPSLTTIRQPVEKMAKATIENLFDMMKKGGKKQREVLSASLVVRESTMERKTS